MGKVDIYIEKIDSFGELESLLDKEQLILCDDMQNKFFIVNFDNVRKLGVAYYDYGVAPDFQCSGDSSLFYLGFGENFLCIDIYEDRILVNDKLQSVFYELCYDSNKNYICVICELDVYCYCAEKLKWKMGFRDIIIDYKIIDDTKISILCNDGVEYIFFLKDGNIVE